MKFTKLAIPEVVLIEPKVHEDSRGFFMEYFREDLFQAAGFDYHFVQANHSRSLKGVLRGLHYQLPPHAQAKMIRVIRGSVFDVAVDLRKNSKTFGKYVGEFLSAENKKMLLIPEGFAHGILALEEYTEILYKSSNFYSPKDERGVLWSDPDIGIVWPEIGRSPLLSDKDKLYPRLKDADCF